VISIFCIKTYYIKLVVWQTKSGIQKTFFYCLKSQIPLPVLLQNKAAHKDAGCVTAQCLWVPNKVGDAVVVLLIPGQTKLSSELGELAIAKVDGVDGKVLTSRSSGKPAVD